MSRLNVSKIYDTHIVADDNSNVQFDDFERSKIWSEQIILDKDTRSIKKISRAKRGSTLDMSTEELHELGNKLMCEYEDGIYYRIEKNDILIIVPDSNYTTKIDTWDNIISSRDGRIKVVGRINNHHKFRNVVADELDLSELNTSAVTSGVEMFNDVNVGVLRLDSFDTSNMHTMSRMFSGFESDSPLDLSMFNTSNVTDMGEMFSYAEVPSVDFSSFDTSNVTRMVQMFGYSEMNKIDISNFKTPKLVNMSYMFLFCTCNKITFGDVDTSHVKYMTSMFRGCKTGNLDLSSFNTKSVKSFEQMFMGCKTGNLDLSSFDTKNVESFEQMFEKCDADVVNMWNSDKRRINLLSNDIDMFKNNNIRKLGNSRLYSKLRWWLNRVEVK